MQQKKEIKYRHEIAPASSNWASSTGQDLRTFVSQSPLTAGVGIQFWPKTTEKQQQQKIWNSVIDEVRKKSPFRITRMQWIYPTNERFDCNMIFFSSSKKSILSAVILEIKKLLNAGEVSQIIYWGIESFGKNLHVSLQKFCLVTHSWTVLFTKEAPCFEGSFLLVLREIARTFIPDRRFQGSFRMWELPRKSHYSFTESDGKEPALEVLAA